MSFDLSAISLKVETKQLDEAIEKLNKLQQATSKVEQEVKKQGKAAKDSSEEQGKSVSKAEKLVEKLKQTYEDLSNEFTRGESAVLRYARSLGVSGQEMQVIIGYLQNIKKLSKDPFDDSIGSVRRIKREYEELTNRTDLLAKGISLTTKQAREYSKLADEIAGKMQAQKLDPMGKDAAIYSERLAKSQEEYLKYVKQVSDLKQKESPVVQSKSSIAVSPVNMDQHVLAYQSNLLKTEAAEKKSFDRRLENLRNFNSRREQSLNQMQGAGGVTTAEMANIAGQESALRRLGVGKISDLVGNHEAMLEVQRAGDNAVKAWNAANRTIKSSREMAFAMRQVPMQITDIVVSLAGGQSPFQVLLQQGGQLKDLFGGVKEAAVALGKGLIDSLGSAFRLLISPIGLAISAITLFGTAIYKGADWTESINKSIILLGSSAKQTHSEIYNSSKQISSATDAGLAKSSESLLEISKASGLTGDALISLTKTAIDFEKYGGSSIKETSDMIKNLNKDPLKAIEDITEKGFGFMTPAVYKNITALLEQGKAVDASKLAIQTLSEYQAQAADKLKENLGYLPTLWNSIKDTATAAWNAMMGWGAKKPNEQLISDLEAAIPKMSPLEASYARERLAKMKANLPKATSGGSTEDQMRVARENLNAFTPKRDRDWLEVVNRAQKDQIANLRTVEETQRYLKAKAEEIFGKEKDSSKKGKTFGVDFGVRGEYDKYINKQLEAEDKYLETQKKISKQGNDLLADYQLQTKEQLQQLEIKSRVLGMSAEEKFVEEAKLKSLEQYQKIRERILQQMPEGYQKDKALTDAEAAYNAQVKIVESQAKLYYQNMESFSTGWDKTYEKYKQDTMTAAGFAEKAFTKMADGMTDAIMQFVTTGKISFKDFTASILSDLLRIQIRKQAVGLLGDSSGSIAGIGSSIAGLLGLNSSADTANLVASGYNLIGGNGGSYTPALFANGGAFTNSVVNNPTLFKFANGAKFGVMGEAGPEAVMPLSRDSSGRLGVTMQGGSSGDVQVVINNTGTSSVVTNKTESVDSRGNRRIELTLADAVAGEAARPGSSMYNATRNSFGLKPALVSR